MKLGYFLKNFTHVIPACVTTEEEAFLVQVITRVEVPEVISAEQRCFIVLTFFSADSENMINISADQLCFRADQL